MTTLYLLRHGETQENLAHILQGQSPGHLTERGREQAREAAGQLCHVTFDAILTSDLQRCVDTTDILVAHLQQQPRPNVIQTALLRERDWGSATGMVVDGTHRITIPKDAESMPAIKARARVFLNYIKDTYKDKTVLAVSHGLFCRVLQMVHLGVEMNDVARMDNMEFRILEL